MNFTYSTSQFGPATLHVPSCLTWLVETVQCYTWGRRKFPSAFCAEFFLRWKGLGKRVGGKHGTQTSLHWHLLPNSFFHVNFNQASKSFKSAYILDIAHTMRVFKTFREVMPLVFILCIGRIPL